MKRIGQLGLLMLVACGHSYGQTEVQRSAERSAGASADLSATRLFDPNAEAAISAGRMSKAHLSATQIEALRTQYAAPSHRRAELSIAGQGAAPSKPIVAGVRSKPSFGLPQHEEHAKGPSIAFPETLPEAPASKATKVERRSMSSARWSRPSLDPNPPARDFRISKQHEPR